MNFESELKNGKFVLSECSECDKIVWPPSEFCDKCLKKTKWKKSSQKGEIIEFSKQENKIFCVVQMDKSIRIIGEIISGNPNVGKSVLIASCGVKDNVYLFKFIVEEN